MTDKKTIKVSDLTGAALDWAVAECEDFNDGFAIIRLWNNSVTKIIPGDYETPEACTSYSPSTNWAQGGPIIEREGLYICLTPLAKTEWMSTDEYGQLTEYGPTPLIAAMRCYVASKLGDTVEVPEELTT